MKKMMPAALFNHLKKSNQNQLSKAQFSETFKAAFPGLQGVESNNQRSLKRMGDVLSGVKFPNMGILFGSHNPYHFFAEASMVPSLVLPIEGVSQMVEEDGNKIASNGSDAKGLYLTSRQKIASHTSSVEALAIGFEPAVFLRVLKSVSGNPDYVLPNRSFEIDFKHGKQKFLLERFLFSLNAVGALGAFNEVTQDMIMRHCAYLVLEAQGTNLSTRVIAHKSNVIDHVCAYMYENLSEPLTLSGLEAVAGISVRSLQIEFKKRFQLSPLCWLREQRLLRAHQLLQTDRDNRPVSTVAKECGFTHFGRFSVSFKKKFGISASELKKSSYLTVLEN